MVLDQVYVTVAVCLAVAASTTGAAILCCTRELTLIQLNTKGQKVFQLFLGTFLLN